ncbi:glycine receptor subunit alpha-2-like [Liolophura sinensis]|uniref:glycine receptor subunit alpha-2-like n=1 Tax=Liolophura sinensis TaxID=3198878 RepID=UPI00315840A0
MSSGGPMDFTVNMFLKQQWTDFRLHFHDLVPTQIFELDSRFLRDIWIPDLYFVNGKGGSIHDITTPNRLIHVYRDAKVKYNIRVSMSFSCPMDLTNYPLDRQICYIDMASFAYTKDKLIFRWSPIQPIRRSQNIKLPQFELIDIRNASCEHSLDVASFAGDFSCVRAELHLRRQIGYFGVQVYVPSASIVGISWISFWLDVDAVPARISLNLLAVLTMTTQFSSVRDKLPSVIYITALDIWMSVCLLFVICSLVEFALVNVLVRQQVKQVGKVSKRQRLSKHSDSTNNVETIVEKHECAPDETFVSATVTILRGKLRAKKVDKSARIFFPLAFAFFNLAYWCSYLSP